MAGNDRTDPCAADGRRPSLTMAALGGQPQFRKGNAARWFFSLIWLVYLIAPVAALFQGGHSAGWIAGGVVLAAAFCIVYVLVLGRWENRPSHARLGLAVIAAIAVLASAIYGSDWTSMWIYVSAATGFVIPGRRAAMLAVVAVAGGFLLTSRISHASASNYWIVMLPVLLTGWAMIGFRMQIMLMKELRQARETVAKLAANEERLRLARDMHDLTGQSLSLITLKSELAAKRLARMPESAELDTVRNEITDIGRVSRQTLHDIREAVSGYRRPTLAIEIITARTSLEAAGINLDDDPALTMRSGTFDPDTEAALAWCLREAATNVIRHSGAASCRIRLTERSGELSLEVSDDGRGLSAPSGSLPAGTGLHGMSERLSAVGGRFSVASTERDGRGFRLVATVPAAPKPKPAVPAPATEAAPATGVPTTEPPQSGPVDANVPS